VPFPLPWRKGMAQQLLRNSEPKHCRRWLGFKWMGEWNERMFPDVPLHLLHTFSKHLPLFARGSKNTCSLFFKPPAFNTPNLSRYRSASGPSWQGDGEMDRGTKTSTAQRTKVARTCQAWLVETQQGDSNVAFEEVPTSVLGIPRLHERESPHAKLSGTHKQRKDPDSSLRELFFLPHPESGPQFQQRPHRLGLDQSEPNIEEYLGKASTRVQRKS
jgi:hypothetical protein